MEQGTAGGSKRKQCGRPVKDRTGQRFGKLTVIRFVDTKPGHARWLCRCDCGNETIVTAGNLLKAVGCGCGQVASRVAGRSPGETARLRVLGQYQRNAQRRGFSWDLSDEDFDGLTSSDCFYCGQPPGTVYRSGKYEGGEFTYNGLDRRDSTAGYLPDNVVACCPLCNRAKSDMSYGDFMAWLARLTAHQWFNPELMPSRLLKGGAYPCRRLVNEAGLAK